MLILVNNLKSVLKKDNDKINKVSNIKSKLCLKKTVNPRLDMKQKSMHEGIEVGLKVKINKNIVFMVVRVAVAGI